MKPQQYEVAHISPSPGRTRLAASMASLSRTVRVKLGHARGLAVPRARAWRSARLAPAATAASPPPLRVPTAPLAARAGAGHAAWVLVVLAGVARLVAAVLDDGVRPARHAAPLRLICQV